LRFQAGDEIGKSIACCDISKMRGESRMPQGPRVGHVRFSKIHAPHPMPIIIAANEILSFDLGTDSPITLCRLELFYAKL